MISILALRAVLILSTVQISPYSCDKEKCEPLQGNITANRANSSRPFYQFSCFSLNYIAIPQDTNSNTTININLSTQSSNLTTEVLFSNVHQVEVVGTDGGWSEIICSGNSSGLRFINIQKLCLENLRLSGCGVKVHGSLMNIHVHAAAILVSNSVQVDLMNLTLADSKEFGVALFDVESSSISECRYEGQHSETVASRGVFLQISQSYTNHIIQECSFSGNGAPCCCENCSDSTKILSGASLTVLLKNNSNSNLLEISDCNFEHNTAHWGGAMYLEFQGSSSNNSVILLRAKFSNNSATEGGGAIAVGITTSLSDGTQPMNNEVNITENTFERNTAFMGGAFHLFLTASRCHSNAQNKVQLKNSTWRENSATYGAAVDARIYQYGRIKDGATFLLVHLEDSTFERNTVRKKQDASQKGQSSGEGTVRIAGGIKLKVHETLLMAHCTGSAIYMESSSATFMSGSKSTFRENKGYRGGAIALYGKNSYINISENCSIVFFNNTAKSIGGAIYQQISTSCFIHHKAIKKTSCLEFWSNSASRYGHSLYASSLQSCHIEENEGHLPTSINFVNFTFMLVKMNEVSTLGKTIAATPERLKLSPGEKIKINITTVDETGSIIQDIYSVPELNLTTDKNASDDTANIFRTGSNIIRFPGRPGKKGELKLTSIFQPNLKLTMNVELLECPPGYNYLSEPHFCFCSAASKNKSDRYIGIDHCNIFTFQASLRHGHWAGYISDSSEVHAGVGGFLTGFCPRGFCKQTSKTTTDVVLPSQNPSGRNLSAFVCNNNREGILCARCTENHSVSFADYRNCQPNKNCHLGILYYILSNLVPTTVVFTTIIGLDISLTSGAISGVIFYAQVFPNLLLTGNDFLWFEPAIFKMIQGLKVITYTFSLRFFTTKTFDFCLWEGAGFLDAATFSFLSVVYSLLLIVITIKAVVPCIQKLRSCQKGIKSKTEGTRLKKSKSIIHGLTSFLILCYSKSTTLSLYILGHVTLYAKGGEPQRGRVFYNGELEYLKDRHLYYALPAFFFLVVVTVVPPLLLLSYPLCYRVLALCRIQESRFTRLICKAIPLEKYKPLFDSFQGSFKDEHRYFAGLEFTNRLVIAVTVAYVRELATFYVLLEFELIVMLVLVAYMQPHKNSWHNKINTFILSTLLIINTGTIWRYHQRGKYSEIQTSLEFVDTGALQVSVAYLPFLYLLGYVVWQIGLAIKRSRNAGVPIKNESEFVLSRIDHHSANYVSLKDSYSPPPTF